MARPPRAGARMNEDRGMLTTAVACDKYRITNRDISNRHGYTVHPAALFLAHRSIRLYENSHGSDSVASGTSMLLCYLMSMNGH